MTFEEKLALVMELGNKFTAMDRFCSVVFSCYPHDESNGFSHGQIAYEVALNGVSEGMSISGQKTPEEGLNKLLLKIHKLASSRADEKRRAADGAAYWDQIAARAIECELIVTKEYNDESV